jgi:hypothetical protein
MAGHLIRISQGRTGSPAETFEQLPITFEQPLRSAGNFLILSDPMPSSSREQGDGFSW